MNALPISFAMMQPASSAPASDSPLTSGVSRRPAPTSTDNTQPTSDPSESENQPSRSSFHSMLHGMHDHDEEEERPKSKPAKKESSNKDAVADTTQQAPAKDHKPLALSLPNLGIQANVAAAQSQPAAASTDGKEDIALKIGGGGRKQSGNGHIKMMPISISFGRTQAHGLEEAEEEAETKAKGITAQDIEAAGEESQNETRGVRSVPEANAVAQNSKVAFEASLRANPKAGAQPSPSNKQPSPKLEAPGAQQSKTDAHAPRPASAPTPANKRDDSERERQDHSSKSDESANTLSSTAKDSPAAGAFPAATAVDPTIAASAAHAAGHGTRPAPPVDTPAASASSPAPTSTSEAAAPAEPAPITAPTTDIKIAVGDGGQRVELRISERAGDIHVAVKTPDSQLANALRNDLPSLSTKLEQSGFHADMWRPEASSGEMRTPETANANTSSDSNQEPGGRHQSEQEQQQQRNQQQQQHQNLYRKTAGKEFSWLFESIR